MTYNISQQASLAYCPSDPIGNTSARLVWSKVIIEILAVAFGTKAAAMILAWFCIRYYDGFPSGFPWSALDKTSWAEPLAYILISGGIAGFTFFINYLSPRIGPFGSGSSPAYSTDSNFILSILVFQNALRMTIVIREFLESNYFQALEMRRTAKPRWFVSLPVMQFLWNLGLHQLVSAWLSAAMLDCYPIGSISDPNLPSKPTLVSDPIMSGHIGLPKPFKNSLIGAYIMFAIPFLATGLQILGVLGLYNLCGRQTTDNPETQSASVRNSPRRSIWSSVGSTPLQQLSGPSHISLLDENNSL